MMAKRVDNDKKDTRHRACTGAEHRGERLSIEDIRRRVTDLGLATPSEAAAMVRKDRDSR